MSGALVFHRHHFCFFLSKSCRRCGCFCGGPVKALGPGGSLCDYWRRRQVHRREPLERPDTTMTRPRLERWKQPDSLTNRFPDNRFRKPESVQQALLGREAVSQRRPLHPHPFSDCFSQLFRNIRRCMKSCQVIVNRVDSLIGSGVVRVLDVGQVVAGRLPNV